jgi:phage tail-like protein
MNSAGMNSAGMNSAGLSDGPTRRPRTADLLPSAMIDDDFTARFTAIFDQLLDDLAALVESAPVYFDASTTSVEFVRLLASWTNTAVPDAGADVGPVDDHLVRRFVQQSALLNRWRGTRRGLEMLMGLATGGAVEVDDPGGVSFDGDPPIPERHRPVVIRIHAPGGHSDLLDALAGAFVPAGVHYEIRDEGGDADDA